jgi:4-amino-4-deoxy-L-arabinose transferase-like glycosyltransferase
VYCLLLAVLGSVAFFTNLGRPMLYADEAQYALCVEHARESSNWLTFSPYPPEPYFLKPPMYFWLTELTYRFFDEGIARYRFWSALFGVGSVVLTCVLGAQQLSPEAGLLGALLLMGNQYFQKDHGARTGSMDTAITFLGLACTVLYLLLRQGKIGTWGWWAVGVAAGISCLFKPAAGLPIMAILAIHSFFLDAITEQSIDPFVESSSHWLLYWQ